MQTIKEIFPEMNTVHRFRFSLFLKLKGFLADGKKEEVVESNAYKEERIIEILALAAEYKKIRKQRVSEWRKKGGEKTKSCS